MVYPSIKISKSAVYIVTALMLNGCFLQTNNEAWPGVSDGSISSAPDFAAPVGGGSYGQRTPPDVMQNQYGYRGEDLASTRPSMVGEGNGLYSYDSSQDSSMGAAVSRTAQAAGSGSTAAAAGSSTSSAAAGTSMDETYDPADPVEDWLASEGSSIRSLLTEWGDKSGWRVVWNTDREYVLEAGAMFRGRFMDVASALIRSFARAQPAPWGTFYKGNRVLLVTTLEDENAD